MRYEDASGTFQASGPIANDDSDVLTAGSRGPATGNVITGEGTQYGSAGADSAAGARVTALAGKGGEDTSFAGGKLSVAGEFGQLSVDAQGNYSYLANAGAPENVRDRFVYTLADAQGATDTAALIVEIGKTLVSIRADAQQIVPGPDGVVTLPPGVELSDIMVVGRNLVVNLPDGTQLIIIDGAVFVPQLVLGGVEVPATNVAALLIGQEVQPAAGETPPSGGGNFALPPPPLDPGIPLGDLIPPTEYNYIPPEPQEVLDTLDDEPEAGAAAVQLDDDVIPGKGGNAGGTGDDAPDTVGQNVASGFLPGSDGDGDLEWSLLETGAPAGFTYDLQPDGSVNVIQVQDGNPVVVLTIEVNADTGAFEVTQNNPIRHATGDNENNVEFVIGYEVTDEDGDVATGTLTVNVDDDTPTASVTAGSDTSVILTTDDAQTIGVNSDTAVTLADFSGVFTGTTTSAGADGAGAGTTGGYTLAVTSQTSGLMSHGVAINLYMVGGTVVGATGSQPADLNDADIVFTVAVDGNGVVTLTQMQQIDHAPENPSDSPFNDQFANMADGLVTLTRSVTVVDNDGDSVTASATVSIGQNLHFTDDGPTVDGADLNSSVTLDETDGGEPVSSGAPIVVTSAAPIIVGGAVNYGADGQGPDPVYGLSLMGGGPVGSSIASGLQTALGDFPITLTLTSSTLITATYVDGTGTHTAFTIQMNPSGTITVTQNTALEHLIDGPTPADHDDSLSLVTIVNEVEVSLVNATVTYQDFDGDTATATAPIGGAIIFKDDGPSIDITVGSDANILLVTDDDGTEDAGSTTDSTDADFSGAFSLGSSNGGGDGTASTSLISYSLSTLGGDSGLTSNGDQINLYLVGTTVVGAIGSQPADLNDADIVFTVSVDSEGVVTLTQLQQIDHPAADDPDGTDAPFDDHTISLVDNLITLHAEATITDNDGDTDSDTASLDIGANLVFRDDGPTIDASLVEGASIHVDESDPGTDGPGETDDPGLGQVTVALADIVDVVENPESADQPTTVTGYALVLGPATGGLVASGLMTSAGNLPIYLYMQLDGSVIGSTALTAETVAPGNTVFTVEIVGSDVVLTQFQAVEHDDAPDNFDENTSGLATNALQLQVTAEDFDGDTDTDNVDLGSIITFGDDGPSVEVVVAQLPTGGEALDAVQLVTQDDGTEDAGFTTDSTTANFGGLFSLNKDGGSDGEASSSLTFDLDLVGVGNGPVDSGLDSHGQTIWLYQINANTIIGSTSAVPVGVGHASVVFQLSTTDGGVVTLTQYQQVDHPAGGDPDGTDAPFDDHEAVLGSDLINLVATGTITDNDGDIDTDTETLDMGGLVRFQDDGPTIDATLDANASVHVDESDPGVDGPGETDNPGLGQVTVALSAIVDVVENPESADQPTTLDYALTLGPDEGGLVDSGLTTSAGDLPIYLYVQLDGSVAGSTALNAGAVNAGNTVFTVAIVGSNVVLTQFQAIEHPDAGPPGPDHDENTLGLADGALLLEVTGTDFDGDTDSDTVDLGSVITFGDDGPTCTDEAQQTVAENAPNVLGTFDFDGGSDGASVTHLNATLLNFDAGTGWSQWIPVDDGQIRAKADGSYEFDPDGNASGVTSGTFTVTDADGDTDVCDWSFNITDANQPSAGSSNALLDDDGLVVPADPVLEAGNGDINANTGEVATVEPSEAIFHGDLNASFGGDGPGSINFAAMVGQFRMVGTERVEFTWNAGTLTLTAIVAAEDGGGNDQDRAGTELFEVVLDPSFNGNYTLTLLDNVLHAEGGDDETSAPNVSLTFNIVDADNSPAGGVPGTLVVTFNDDMPEAAVDGTVDVPTVTLDETRPEGEDEGGPNVTTGLASITVGFADNFMAEDYGADGPGSVSYALVLEAEGTASGMYALDNSDTETVDDGYGQGAEILLYDNAGVIEGRVGDDVYFTISVNADGEVTFTQLLNVWHSDTGDDDDTSGLSAAAETLQLEQTITDADGDSDSALIDLSDGVFFIEDDGPRFGPDIDATLNIDNDATPSGIGDLDITIGTDSPNGGSGNNNPDDLSVSGFTVMVNNVAATNVVLTQGAENATTANYTFSFDYDTGDGGTATATGTLVFNKSAGTYTVELTNGPIEGFSIASVQGDADGATFYTGGVVVEGSGEVAVSELADDFFIQFTGRSEVTGSSGTFGHDEIFNGGTAEDVKISSVAIGVHGNSVQDSDVLDYNFHATDPGGTIAGPTTTAGTAFIQITQFNPNGGEDFIVVLKLADPNAPGTFITRTVVVETADVLTVAPPGFPALEGGEGYIVFEPNDYINLPGVPDNYEIAGMQLRSSNEGLGSEAGETYNFNGAVGAFDNSTHAFDVPNNTGTNDNDVFKIIDIGVIRTSTEDQSATINFNVTIHDADGDTATQAITVNIGDPVAPAALPSDPQSFSAMSSESLLASDSSDSEQLQKSAANSNTLTMAAAVAAAGMADAAAASPPADDQSFDAESESSAGTQQVDMVLADDGGDEGGSLVSGLPDTSEAEAPGNSGGHSRSDEHRSDNKVDAGSNQQPSDDGSSHQAANDQGPATETAAANAVAPTVGMPSAEALVAAGLTGETAKHTGQVEEILADALGQGGAPTVDGLLAHLSGGLGELAAISNVASPAAGDVPGWDMAMHGGSGFAADVLTKLDAAMLQHHDAVQPAVNG